MLHDAAICLAALSLCAAAMAATPEQLTAERQVLRDLAIQPGRLKPLMLDTALVEDGRPRAIICHADRPAWREAAQAIQAAIREATGCELPVMTDAALSFEDADAQNVILLGYLDNNRHVARLYHNFFVCLDVGYTGREGYVIRSVHDPWGAGHSAIVVGGSFAEGTALAAQAFAGIVADGAQGDSLSIGRQMVLVFDPTDRQEATRDPMTAEQRDAAIRTGRDYFASPGQGRSGASLLFRHGINFQRTGDPLEGEAYKGLMAALEEYYETDEYINSEGLGRYDTDFRDAWAYQIGVLWDLHEESGLFSDEERVRYTNLVMRLMLEIEYYQGYERNLETWRAHDDLVHNHNTFPALGAYFIGNYFRRHYDAGALAEHVQMWLDVAEGVFRGQRHSPKPLEDAAGYQWLPMIHLMAWSLASGDTIYFDEGHALATARVAMMVSDNAGYQAAFGDHSGYLGASGIGAVLPPIAWYTRDPGVLWQLERVGGRSGEPLGQPYYADLAPEPPTDMAGVSVARLPRMAYDYAGRSPQYPTEPNLPFELSFDKLTFREGLAREDAYLLLDGFGRGTHMHFDANAIIRYTDGGEPLLVDGEYIKNGPKYHSSLVILRDGQSELTPAVTGLGATAQLPSCSFSRTWLTEYNGAQWQRRIVWRPGDYVLVDDRVEALQEGDFTLRCCWRPWGEAVLEGDTLTVQHPPMTLQIVNGDPALGAGRLEYMKMAYNLPIHRLSQQVGVRLGVGDAYRFVNVIESHPQEQERAVTVRRVGDGLAVVRRPEGADVIALGAEGQDAAGANGEAELLVVTPTTAAVAGAEVQPAGSTSMFVASAPIAIELDYPAGRGRIVADVPCEGKVFHVDQLHVDGEAVSPDPDGAQPFTVTAGRHELRFTPCAMPEQLAQIRDRVLAMPALAAAAGGAALQAPPLQEAWQAGGFDAPLEALRVDSVTSDLEPTGRYTPVDKLIDGGFSSSQFSVQWEAGATPTMTLELPAETEISSVVLREWHMSDAWDIGERHLAISSDGFVNDVREITAPFVEAGTEQWGGNINTLIEVPVHQSARQLRLTVSPARDDSNVYIAEVQVLGTRPGAMPEITAVATGDLTGQGAADMVVASAGGQVRALDAAGAALWTATLEGRPRVNSMACADFDGDGRTEVAVGSGAGRLTLLSSQGKVRWAVVPPQYRGIDSDVMVVLPADVDGDGTPEIIAGAASWQYFAYDGAGEMLWSHVIYAHSATVSCAADFDGDGLPEIVGGNEYYSANLIDNDGERIFRGGRLGPEQTAAGAVDADGDGLPEMLLGTDLGELVCFDLDASALWRANLGDKVTRILTVDLDGDGADEVVCSAESANVYALDASGQLIWRTAVPDGVTDLVLLPGDAPRFAAAAGATGVVLLDARGQIIGDGAIDGRAGLLAVLDGRVAVTTDQGQVAAFAAGQ